MATFVISGGDSAQIADGTQTRLKYLSIAEGQGFLQVGDSTPEGYRLKLGAGILKDVILPPGFAATLHAEGFHLIASVGDYGEQEYDAGALPADQAAISDGDSLTVVDGDGTSAIGTIAVAGGAGGSVTLPAANAIVAAGSVTLLPATGTTPAQGAATRSVAAGVESVRLAATRVAITTAATAPVQNSAGTAIGTGTITVAANAITNIRLPATIAGVADGATFTTVDGGTLAVAVAAGVPTFTYTAP